MIVSVFSRHRKPSVAIEIHHNHNGRGLYFSDPNGHVLEIITTDYNIDEPIS